MLRHLKVFALRIVESRPHPDVSEVDGPDERAQCEDTHHHVRPVHNLGSEHGSDLRVNLPVLGV